MTPLRETRCPQKFYSRVIRFQRIAIAPTLSTSELYDSRGSSGAHGTWACSNRRSFVLVSEVFVLKSVISVPPSATNNPESSHATRIPSTLQRLVHILKSYTYMDKRMHRVEAVQRNRANVCVNERRVEGAESRMPVFPGPRIGTGYLVWFYSIFQLINNIFSFAFCDCFWFLSILNLFSKKLKREFQFYNYGSSDVNTDFVNGGHNIVARVFVLRNFFLIV